MIDTHAHVYQHVTGAFGMNPDLVGVRSGVTTVIDQGGASPLTITGFRKFIAEPARTGVYSYISNYLVGGLVGHRYTELYGPHGINVRETVRAIEANRDLVKGIKAHAEIGGYSRWGIETLRLAKLASREAGVPVSTCTSGGCGPRPMAAASIPTGWSRRCCRSSTPATSSPIPSPGTRARSCRGRAGCTR
jgi:dihydroorotase